MKKTWSDKFKIAKEDFEKQRLSLSNSEIEDAYAQNLLDTWIKLAEGLEKEKLNVRRQNSILRSELATLRHEKEDWEESSIVWSEKVEKVEKQAEQIKIASDYIMRLEAKLEDVLGKKRSFHTPGSAQKLHGQTIRGILNAYERGHTSVFLKENKTSRATFYNVIGRKYKNEEYNVKIENIAKEMDILLPERS